MPTRLFGHMFSAITRFAKKSPRKRKAISDVLGESPSAKIVKERCLSELDKLKQKRSKKCLAARKLLLDTVHGHGTGQSPGKYAKKMSAAAAAVHSYLEDVAVDLPGKRSVDKRTMKQKKILPKRVKRLHRDFCQTHPQLKVSRATFYRHIPPHILTAGKQTHRQCLCEICTSVDKKLDVVNKHLEAQIDGRDDLSEASLCSPPTLDCINRLCDACGVPNVRSHLYANLTVGPETVVKWTAWEMVHKGKSKRRDLVNKEGTVEQLINLLMKELKLFSKHLFVFRWQHNQFKTCKAAISNRPQLALVVLDFAENFLCKYQDEVQSAHWGYSQVTVHPAVTYYKCPNSDCTDIVTDYLVFFSDDLTHDACLAKVIMERMITHLSDRVQGLQNLVVYSDGCAAQYKSKLPLYHLANTSGPATITRAYFGSRHGKSPCDACGGVIKRAVDEDVLAGDVMIQSASAMFSHCTTNHILPVEEPAPGVCCHTRRSFCLVMPDEVDRSFTSSSLHTLPGTRMLHCVQGLGENVVQTRKLACFCQACLDKNFNECENADFVDRWETVKIKVRTPVLKSCAPPPAPAEIHPPTETSAPVYENHPPMPHIPNEPPSSPTPEVPPTPIESHAPHGTSALENRPLLPRNFFFRHLYRDINNCRSYEELEALVSSTDLSFYELPTLSQSCIVGVNGSVDKVALGFRPASVPSDLFPIVTSAEGNCLPCCLSVLAYGTENHHLEMRCRIIVELVKNKDRYIVGSGMGDNPRWVVSMLSVLQEGLGLTLDTVTDADILRSFIKETMEVRRRSVTMGLWQMAAGASILQAPVTSVYPEKGWKVHIHLYNRILLPLTTTDTSTAVACHIMWSSNRSGEMSDENWVGNHFVCLLPLSQPSASVSVENACGFTCYHAFAAKDVSVSDFFMVTWKGNDYVTRVDEVSGDTLLLNMMAVEKGLYVWPVRPDLSLENSNVLKHRVGLELVLENSTQRKQFYKIV